MVSESLIKGVGYLNRGVDEQPVGHHRASLADAMNTCNGLLLHCRVHRRLQKPHAAGCSHPSSSDEDTMCATSCDCQHGFTCMFYAWQGEPRQGEGHLPGDGHSSPA